MVVQIKNRFDLSFESDRYFTEYVGIHLYVTHVPFVHLLQWFFSYLEFLSRVSLKNTSARDSLLKTYNWFPLCTAVVVFF